MTETGKPMTHSQSNEPNFTDGLIKDLCCSQRSRYDGVSHGKAKMHSICRSNDYKLQASKESAMSAVMIASKISPMIQSCISSLDRNTRSNLIPQAKESDERARFHGTKERDRGNRISIRQTEIEYPNTVRPLSDPFDQITANDSAQIPDQLRFSCLTSETRSVSLFSHHA